MTDTEVLPGLSESQSPPVSPTVAPDAGEGAPASPEAPRSLRDELRANFAADTAKQGEGVTAVTGVTAPGEAKPGTGGEQDKARNELGQFVKQADKAPVDPKTPSASGEPSAAAPKVPVAGTGTAQPQAIAPPASWSPAAKAAFPTLPEQIQREVLKREGEINQGLAQRSQDAERLNRLHEVLAPYTERFRLAGVHETQAIQQLLSASDFLDRDPVNALLYLARTKGVDPRYLAQVFAGGANGQQPMVQPSPEYQQLAGQVQALQQTLQQRDTDQVTAQYQHMLTQVDSFAQNPAHTYFENVREPMAKLIEAGMATDLDDAYAQATWAHPEIRPLLLQQQFADQQKAATEAAKARAAGARHASGSVTGSPSPGATTGLNGSKLSLRDELTRNWEEFSS